jgi:nucleoside-diphosphate-sugar epimerase
VIVLVTGAEGNLGRVLVPALRDGGYDVRTFDARGGDVTGDVRDAGDVGRAVEGAEAIVHAAALHGVHLGLYPPQDFWQTNVTGTFNVYDAAASGAVARIVLCSTMGVYGHKIDDPAIVYDGTPVAPGDVYGMSKALAEEIARAYTRIAGITTVALRLGMFVPETWERYGFRLLFGGVDDRDVAQAVVRALSYEPDGGFDAMNVMADVPFDDPFAFADDPAAVIEEHWPGTSELGFDVDELVWGATIWLSNKARERLGWRPQYGFGEFLAAHRRGDRAHYPFAELPQWGV